MLQTAIAMSVLLCLAAAPCRGQASLSIAEQYLFQAANAERAEHGLPPLQWDAALYRAAMLHAREMAERASISHQYPGEADLAARAGRAGARFSVVAENVAEAPDAVHIHSAWMRSPGHRANLLDARVDRVGIGVLSRDGEIYAVEDFDRSVAQLLFGEQELAIAGLLGSTDGLRVSVANEDARQTCGMSTGYAGPRRPWFVMRFTTGDLLTLPEQLRARLATGRYHEAVVGACAGQGAEPFTSYNIAVLLFP